MVKFKEEVCAQLANAKHPFFKSFIAPPNGNFLDPCPFTVCSLKKKILTFVFNLINYSYRDTDT